MQPRNGTCLSFIINQSIKELNFPKIFKKFLSHIHYSATVIQSINQSLILTLDKKLNWAVKSSFFRKKFNSSRDLKLKQKILPMHYFLKLKRINYIWNIKTNQLPAFDESRGREHKTWKINKNQRSGLEYWGYKFKSSKLENSIVRKALQDWNSLPCLLIKNEIKKNKSLIIFLRNIKETLACSYRIVYLGTM